MTYTAVDAASLEGRRKLIAQAPAARAVQLNRFPERSW